MSATHESNSSTFEPVLYVALELSQTEWKLAFATGAAQKPRRREIPARDIAGLRQEIATAKHRFDLPAETRVVSCYEAGRDGFWLHRFLATAGVENQVVDSSSIAVERRGRRAKTDRLDAEKLLAMLIRWHQGEPHVWRVVNAPNPEEESARQLHRELETLKGEQTAHGNRIKGLLAGCGLTVTITRHFPKWLKQARLWDGTAVSAELKARLLREFERMQIVNRQIRDLEKERARRIRTEDQDSGILKMRKLMCLGGIGVNSSWLYVREVFGWRQIKNRRQMGSIVGLTPTPYNSGGSSREQGISRAGNRRMRSMSIEIAWDWLRYQPASALSLWYQRRFGHGSKRQRRIGIVALARKLLVALWKYLERNEVPQGAVVKDWREKAIHYPLSLTEREAA
jgi:transposase